MSYLELSAAELGLSEVDMTAAANTITYSGIVDLRGATVLNIYGVVDVTGAVSTGTAKIGIQRVDREDTAGESVEIGTAINTKVDGTFGARIGGGFAGTVYGMTVGDNIDEVPPFGRCKVFFTVTEQCDAATSCVGSVSLRAQ